MVDSGSARLRALVVVMALSVREARRSAVALAVICTTIGLCAKTVLMRAPVRGPASAKALRGNGIGDGRRELSDVEVHLELVRVRTEADRVHLVGALPLDPGLDQVLGEDVALEEVLVVGLEGVEDVRQRAGHLIDGVVLLRRQLVEVLVDRLWRLDAV